MNNQQIESIYRKKFFGKKKPLFLADNDQPLEYIKRYLPQDRDSFILDAGCGSGKYIRKLNKLGYRNIWGIDLFSFSPAGVKNYIQASIDEIDLPNQSADMIYCLSAIFYSHNQAKALKEFFRILKPGGCLIITAHTKYSLYTLKRILKRKMRMASVRHLKGVSFYSSFKYKLLIEKAGFEIIKIDGYSPGSKIFKNRMWALLRSVFCYHAILIARKKP